MSKYEELLREFEEGKGTFSVGDIRNENKQKKNYGIRIPMLKKEKDTNYRLLPLKSIAIPFDPFTVRVTDTYHEDRKFRTEKTVSTTIGVLKTYYDQNEEAKAALMDKVKVTEWDTSNPEVVTAKDREVFNKYFVTQIFTVYYAHINDKIVTGKKDGADYKLDIPRDESGNVLEQTTDSEGNVVKVPRFIKSAVELADLFSMINLERYKKWEANEGASKTDSEKATRKMTMMGEAPITQDRPKNFILGFKLPMVKGSLELDVEAISKWEEKDFRKAMFITVNSSKLRTAIEEIPRLYSKKDYFADFYEIDMKVPNEDDPQKRGQDTNFSIAVNSINELDDEVKNHIISNIINVADNTPNIDKVVLASSYISPLNEDIMSMLLNRVAEDYNFETLNLTASQIDRFGSLLENIWGQDVSEIMMKAAMGELEEGSVTDKELKENKEQMNALLSEMDNGIDMDAEIEPVTE